MNTPWRARQLGHRVTQREGTKGRAIIMAHRRNKKFALNAELPRESVEEFLARGGTITRIERSST